MTDAREEGREPHCCSKVALELASAAAKSKPALSSALLDVGNLMVEIRDPTPVPGIEKEGDRELQPTHDASRVFKGLNKWSSHLPPAGAVFLRPHSGKAIFIALGGLAFAWKMRLRLVTCSLAFLLRSRSMITGEAPGHTAAGAQDTTTRICRRCHCPCRHHVSLPTALDVFRASQMFYKNPFTPRVSRIGEL